MQETQFLSLVHEDPTCLRAKSGRNYWACVLEPENQSYWSQGSKTPSDPQLESSPHSLQLEKKPMQQPRPSAAKNKN